MNPNAHAGYASAHAGYASAGHPNAAHDPYAASSNRAPPAFARQAAPTPYGFAQNGHHAHNGQGPGQGPQSHQGYHHQPLQQYGQHHDLSAPPPPHSLAPVAMSHDTSRHSSATGTNRSHGTLVIREKPSLKWGVMIALTGALLGGVLGLGMDARRQSARAAAAAVANDAAPATAMTALPQQPAAVAQAPVAAAPIAPAAPVAPAAPAPMFAATGFAHAAPVAAPAVLAPAAPVVVSARHPAARPRTAPPAAKHTTVVAAKATPPKPEPVAKTDPPARAEKPEKKSGANTSEAMKILEAANKDTTNTL